MTRCDRLAVQSTESGDKEGPGRLYLGRAGKAPQIPYSTLGMPAFHSPTAYNLPLSVPPNAAIIKETTELTDLPSLIVDRRHSLFGHICRLPRDTPVSQALHLSIDACPLMPLPVHLLLLTGSAHRDVHGELGFNRWKRTWVYPSVPANSRPWTARCGDRYDPQLVKRSSE